MIRKPSRSALATISLLCLVLLSACSSGEPFLQSVEISPKTASIDAAINSTGNTQQYTATGTYSDGTQKDVTSTTSWASSNSGVVSINASGLATAATPPDTTTVTITGSIGGSAATATLTVVHPIQSIAVTPACSNDCAGKDTAVCSHGNISKSGRSFAYRGYYEPGNMGILEHDSGDHRRERLGNFFLRDRGPRSHEYHGNVECGNQHTERGSDSWPCCSRGPKSNGGRYLQHDDSGWEQHTSEGSGIVERLRRDDAAINCAANGRHGHVRRRQPLWCWRAQQQPRERNR